MAKGFSPNVHQYRYLTGLFYVVLILSSPVTYMYMYEEIVQTKSIVHSISFVLLMFTICIKFNIHRHILNDISRKEGKGWFLQFFNAPCFTQQSVVK